MDERELNALATRVLDAAFAVHSALGPGLLESAYKACLAYELHKRGHQVQLEVAVPLVYDGRQLAETGYRLDILVEDTIVLEIKSLEAIAPVHKAQLLSYLRLSNRRLGYLLNFHVEHFRDGITRRVNGY